MRTELRLFALIAIAALCGCGSLPASKPAPEQPEYPPLLAPKTLGASRDTQQILRAAFGEHEVVLRCAVQVSPQQIHAIALTAMGQRAFSIVWDGAESKIDAAPMVPAALRPEWMLADMQLALWPLPALRAAYADAGWQLSEPGGGVRRLRHNGRLIAEVHYAGDDPWNGRYWISNFRYGYSLAVEKDPSAG